MSICPECHRVVSYQPFRKETSDVPPRYFGSCPNCRKTLEVVKRYFISCYSEEGCVAKEGVYFAWQLISRSDSGYLTRREATQALVQEIIDHINELADRIDHLQSLQEADE